MILLKQTDYAYTTAYIRALENRLLTKSDIEALVLAEDFSSAVQSLRDRGYFEGVISPSNLDEVLLKKLKECRDEIIWASPKDNILNIFLYKNDFHNLKAVLKAVSSKQTEFERFLLSPSTVDYNLFVEAAAEMDFSVLPEDMRPAAEEAFNLLNRAGDSSLAEAVVDKACMDKMMAEAKQTKVEFLIGLIKLENTMADIKIAQRCAKTGKDKSFLDKSLSEESNIERNVLISAAVAGNVLEVLEEKGFYDAAKALEMGFSEFEKYADNAVYDYVKTAAQITFGIEPVIAYLYRKQTEIGTLRVVLNAKYNGISQDEIRSRLREV